MPDSKVKTLHLKELLDKLFESGYNNEEATKKVNSYLKAKGVNNSVTSALVGRYL